MATALWQQCLEDLQRDVSPEQLSTWIKPLQPVLEGDKLLLLAPNKFVLEWVQEHFFDRIAAFVGQNTEHEAVHGVQLQIGSGSVLSAESVSQSDASVGAAKTAPPPPSQGSSIRCALKANLTFDTFIVGDSNQFAYAAAHQVGEHPGKVYNPLFVYGSVGLGKTHLMHAVGNQVRKNNPDAHVLYLHSEHFVADMVNALKQNKMNEFKEFYRSADVLLMDDAQFLAGKTRTQAEFFHTFNDLMARDSQIILTCDRSPQELNGLEDRLKSRFAWGLTVNIDPPELETRVAILISKAEQSNVVLPHEVAFFIAKRIHSNVRELEGALKRVIANAHFTGKSITLEFAKDALQDLLAVHAKLVTIESIQKTVADYFKIKITDLLSKRRNRSITRPRQIAMALAKQVTDHSLPEIGEAFGGRDHTTVLHACRKVASLGDEDDAFKQDVENLHRILTT